MNTPEIITILLSTITIAGTAARYHKKRTRQILNECATKIISARKELNAVSLNLEEQILLRLNAEANLRGALDKCSKHEREAAAWREDSSREARLRKRAEAALKLTEFSKINETLADYELLMQQVIHENARISGSVGLGKEFWTLIKNFRLKLGYDTAEAEEEANRILTLPTRLTSAQAEDNIKKLVGF